MAKTVIALYDDLETARQVVEKLVESGFDRNQVSLIANDASGQYKQYIDQSADMREDVSAGEGAGLGAVVGALIGLGAMVIPGIGPVIAAGPLVAGLVGAGVGAAAGAVTGGITAALVDSGVDEEYAGYYAEGIRRGGTLVVVQTSDTWSERAANLMRQYNPIDLNTRAESWRRGGWTGFDADAQPYAGGQTSSGVQQAGAPMSASDSANETRLPVVEEELRVGKREVEHGGVRVRPEVTEKPVQEQVNLREEHVTVERRPVDRRATEADFMTGEEAFEVTEMAEEPVVSKQARVVEEVVVRKDVDERTETVEDTLRRQDVRVEPVNYADFDQYATDFRQHYTNQYGATGRTYDYYLPAYRYGYTLATEPQYRRYNDWHQLEVEARRGWDTDQGIWDDVKDAVRHAWNRLRYGQ